MTKRCNGAACPALRDSTACGLPNGGCEQNCQTSNGTCYCMPGYLLTNRTHCTRKDCGPPTIDYCPPGEANGTVCKQPWVTCPRGASVYETTCSVSCPSTYRLVGRASIRCETDGGWTDGYNTIYCRRINDPPSDIILSGSHSIAENEAAGTVIGTLSSLDPNSKDSHTYTLISDASYQGKFMINDTELLAMVTFDFETDSKSFLVGVRSTDDGNPSLSFTKYFTIRIVDVNEKPTDLVISSTSVAENSDIGTAVGTFDTIDVDLNQKDNYRLLDSANGMFRINANILEVARPNGNCLVSGSTNCPLNFESEGSYTIEVESYDDKTPSFTITQSFNISVTNRNDPPYNIRLSGNTVKEDAPQGTFIGQFSAEDEDENPKQTFSFSLVDDDGGRFAVSSNGMLTKVKGTDYETDKQHKIQVRVTDSGTPPSYNTKNFEVLVLDVNEPPVNITLNPSQPVITENSAIGSVVCTVEAYDSDFVTSLNLTLDIDAGGLFTISENQTCDDSTVDGAATKCTAELLLNGPINYEKASSLDVSIRASDRGHFISRMFQINVLDSNDAPTDVLINGKKYENVPENNVGAIVGTLFAVDEDRNQTHTFSIVGNDSTFDLDDTLLRLAYDVSFDYEVKRVYKLLLNVIDDGDPSKYTVSSIQINVINVNEAPTDIKLSRTDVDENSIEGTVIANIAVTDPDDVVSKRIGYHVCSFIDSANGRFKIVNGLTLAVGPGELNYELYDNHSVSLQCSDGELTFTKTFTIIVNDVNEVPTRITLSNNKVAENLKNRNLIGTLSTTDPDNLASSRQSFSYSVVGNDSRFEVNGSSLYSKTPFDYETTPVLSVMVSSTDDGKPALTRYENLRIEVVDRNDAPRDILISNSAVNENSGENTIVGTLSTTDDDVSQRYTYNLIQSAQGRFKIERNILKVAQSNSDCLQLGRGYCKLNYEEKSSHQVTVETTDDGTPPLSFSKNITIFLRNVNDQPRGIRLSNYVVNETAPVNFVIGRFSASDEDAGQKFSYVLTDDDNGTFGVDSDGNLYKATTKTNFELKTLHRITVTISDNGYPSLKVSKNFTIEILDVNEAPVVTVIKKDGGQLEFPDNSPRVEENSDIGTVIGTVVSYDSEPVELLTFTLDDSADGTFGLESNRSCQNTTEVPGTRSKCWIRLVLRKLVNFEKQSSHRIIIRTTDNHGLFHTQRFTVSIVDVNDRPTAVTIAGLKYALVSENQAGTLVDDMMTVDEDTGQTHMYSLVGNNSNMFTIYKSYLFLSRHTVFDYEKKTSYKVSINTTDSGRPPLSFIETLELRVRDVNEAPTSITLDGNKVSENSLVGTIVGNLSVDDPDNIGIRGKWQTHSCSVSAGSSGLLTVQGMKLVVAHNGIDFERTPTMNISLRCEDSGRPALYIEKWFTIDVKDVNEKPTDILLSSSTIDENTPPGGIALLSTTDPDNANDDSFADQSFTYTIVNKPSNLPFRIDDSSLQTTRMLNYESQSSWTMTIRSTDDGIPPLFTEKTVIINVTDVNEQPYDISLNNSDVNENSGAGVVVGSLSSSDPDSGQSFSYSLENDAGGLFRIDRNQVKVAIDNRNCLQRGGAYCRINYENQRSVSIRVKTEDSGNPKLSFTKDFTIGIKNINDRPRDIRLSANSLMENATKGFVIGEFTATDEDIGQTITFRLTNDDGGRFVLAGNNSIAKAKDTNYESSKAHRVTVEAEDNGTPPLKIAKDFIIIIEDVNESPTKIDFVSKGGQLSFPKNAARINENSPAGTVVGTLIAHDEDAVERLSFSLDDDAKGAFMVDSSSSCSNTTVNGSSLQTVCSVQLKVSGALDYEKDASRSIVVRATDSKGLHHSQMFTISLVDQNDQPTDITLNGLYRGFVNENENNALIGTLETQDEDTEQRHSYRITNDPGANFIISRGKVYASPHADLNYEKKNLYTINVETTDNGSPSMSYQRNLTVQVLDVNEAPTSLSLSSNQVDENSPVGKAIGNISVVDPDNEGKFNGRQRASCRVIVDTSNMFDVNGDTTLVVKRSNLDFERQSSYTLKLRCTDNGAPRKSLEQEVTVNVNDVNERPSGITLTSGTVSENQGPVLVGRLVVSDPDRTPQRFTLSITDRSLPFNVVGNTLRTTRTLNFEQQHVYRLSIKAIDQGGLSVVDNFTINVQDTNDAPSDILFSGSLSIQENSPAGSPVGIASAVDEDFSQTHTYAIDSIVGERYRAAILFTPLSGYFTIESASGRIQTAVSSIDYEEYTSFNLTVLATDNGIPPRSIRKTTKIKVVDVNHPPTDLTFNGRSVTENSPIGTVVGNFTITDPDNRLSQTQLYSCRVETTAGGDSVPFTISNRLSLTVSGEVNYEKKQLYSLKVTCTEEVPNPYNITKTFILNVVDVNEAPGGINITSNTVAENLDPGSVVGRVYAVDPDNELTFVNNVTITLLSELDFAAFSLVDGNYLVTNRRFDYEQKSRFSIKILATDNGIPALSSTQILDIKIEDMNDRPSSISLSSTTISENSPEGSIIGSLSTTDEDSGQTYSYSIVTTIDNLQIRGRHLIVSGKLDYETESTISIEINVTDSGNPPLSYQKSFNISVTDANDPPSDIKFALYPVAENNTVNQIVANLTIVDEDLNQQVRICSMINNPGYFYFAKDAFSNAINMFIRSTAPLDYEAAPVINATVQCFDNGSPSLSVKKKLSIAILDSNDAPTSVLINGSDVTQLKENSPVEAVVGRLSCLDQDASQSHVYSLQSNGDVFMINENSEILRVKNSSQLNYEALPSSKRMPVRIKVTDNGQPAMSYTGTVQIEITDVNEAPSDVRIMYTHGETIPENLTIGAFIGELHADNPEGFRQHLTFEVVNWQDTFSVTESHGPGKVSYLTVKKELDYDVTKRYNLSIKVTDNGTPPLSAQGIITIDINPTDPCASGSLDCGTEICQRINKTHGNCGCLDGYTPKEGVCVQVNDCKANCLYCDDSKTACQTEVQCLPCDNNATCHDQLKSYKCVCLPGFSDERCKTNIDDCASKPCQHGTCFDLVNKYRCECEKGYEGRDCTDNINECNRKECVKGDCTDLIDGFSCSCTKGAWGLLCNRRESDCSPNKCGTNVCVAPAYKDSKSLDEGGLEMVCANTDQVISLAFSSSSVPDKKEEQAKWKYLLRQFITDLVSIPYYAVDLSEDKSNGGFYAPTDVVFYPFKTSKAKRDTKETTANVILPLVVKVQAKLVPQTSFLRAVNKTCARIRQSSPYWVFCSAAYRRIKDLGITPDPGKSTNVDKSTGGFKILKGNNIYILIGGGAGLLLFIVIALVVRARRKSKRKDQLSDYITDIMKEGGGSYYDAMERHRAERSGMDEFGSVNPMYGEDEDEVEQRNKMFENPLYGTSGLHDSDDDESVALDQDGIRNPIYGAVCLHGEPTSDVLPSAESVDYSKESRSTANVPSTRWSIEVAPKEKIDSDC